MKKAILLMLFIGINAHAQKHDLGKVTVAELEEKVCSIDTTAAAAILFSVGEVKFIYSSSKGFEMHTVVKTKIKIYKKEGYDWANKDVRYYIGGSSKERLSFSEAATYNLVNGKVEKSKLKSDGEFDEKVNKFWGKKKITLPSVKVGSIIEFEYTLISENFGTLENWNFQSTIPTFYSELTTFIPEYYQYKPLFRGFFTPVATLEKNTRSIYTNSKERSRSVQTTTSFSNDKIDYTEMKTNFVLENVPALKEEAFVNNIKNYISSVEHELTSIQFPGQTYKNYATDWETVVSTIYKNDNFGNELSKTGYFEKDIDAILAGVTKQEEKLAAIFGFVKSKMNWNEFYGYSCDEGVKKAYENKVGNAAEINLMLTAMCRYAGFEANPIILSTRGNGVSIFPTRAAFDYVIAGVEINNQVLLLDATNKYALPNIVPIRDLNWFGRLIRKDESSIQIDLMPKVNSIEVINLMAEINAQGEVSGKIRDQYFDYYAYNFRNNYNGLTKESSVEKLEKRYKGLEISGYDVQNGNDLSKPIVENYSFVSSNAVELIGDKMYFSPFLHFALTENPFKQETRLYPIDFVFPNQDKYSISIKIPDGYVVESLPVSAAIALPDNLGNFKYNISNNGNQIQVMFTNDINSSIISSEMYQGVKAFFKEIILKQTEKIVLKKG